MSTVIEIIQDALEDINVLGVGESVSAADSQKCLRTLNQMIGQWQANKMSVFAQKVISFSPDGSQTYTIGPSATINVALPVKIDFASWRDAGGIDREIAVLDSLEQYEKISDKTESGGDAVCVFFQRTYPTGLIYVWPQPTTGSIRLVTRQDLTVYGSLTADLSVPAEYEMAIRYSLAELLAPAYGLQASPRVSQLARQARRVLKRNNIIIPELTLPTTVVDNYDHDVYYNQ